ncbi:MAG: hypothetical protein IJ640_09295 [Prevotella sp.]|nr:hypothetical protein [Prevotella sp.]
MADEGLRIVNTIDNTQMERELQRSRETIMRVAEAAEEAGARIDAAFQKLSQPKASTDYSAIVESAKKAVDEIRKIFDEDINMTNPSQELQKFDEQVVGLCGHLDNYFESLKAKLQDLLVVMNGGESIAGNIQVNDSNIAALEEVKRQNEELREQIQQQTDEIRRQQEQWRQLADAVKTNNVAAIQRLSQETDAATQRIKFDYIKEGLSDVERNMDRLATKMFDLEGQVHNYGKRLKDAQESGDTANIDKWQSKLEEVNAELEETKKEYNDLAERQKAFNDESKELSGHHTRMRTQIMEAREQMVQMIQAGQMATPQFMELAQKAGEMRREMALADAYMQYFGTPNSHLGALKQGLQGVAGAAGVVVGVLGIFNDKSEKMQEIQTKVQSILGVIIGLESTYAAVKKTSNLMIAVQELQTWALVKAKQAEASATALATVKQAAFNLVAKANPYVLLASVIGLLVVGIYNLVKANKDATESEKKHQEEIEKTRKAEQEHAKMIGGKYSSTLSNLMATYKKLQIEYKNLQSTHEKTQWIKDNANEFQNLGVSVNTVDDAERVLVDNTDIMVQAFQYRAQAAAAAAEAMEAYTEAARLEFEKQDHMKKVGSQWKENDIYHGDISRYGLQEHKDFEWNNGDGARLTAAGAAKANVAAARLSAESMKFDEKIEELNQQAERWTAKQVEAEQRIQELLEGASILSFNGGNNDNNRSTDPNDIARAQMIADQKLAKERRDNLILQEQAVIDQMADGVEKELAQMRLNHKKKMNQIDNEQQDILNAKRDAAAKNSKNYYTSGAYKNETLTDVEMLGVDSKRISENEEYAQSVLAYFKKVSGSADSALAKMENLKASYEGIIADIDKQIDELSSKETRNPNEDAQLISLRQLRSEIDNQFLQSQSSVYRALLDKYKDFNTRRLELEKQFNDDVAVIQSQQPTDDEGIARQQAALQERERQYRNALNSLNNEEYQTMQKSSQLFIDLFSDAADMSNKKIRDVIANVQLLLTYLKTAKDANGTATVKNDKCVTTQTITKQQILDLGFSEGSLRTLSESPEKIKAIQDAIEKLQDQAKKNNPFKRLADDISALFEKKDENGETKKSLNNLAEDIKYVVDEVGALFGQLSELFESIDNQGLAEAFGAVEDVMSSVSNIVGGFAEGGLFGGIMATAGEAINYVSKALQASKRHKEALAKVMQEAIAQQREYNLELIRQNLEYEKATTIFGTANWAKAKNAVLVMKDAYAELNKEIEGAGGEFKMNFGKGGLSFKWVEDAYKGLRDIGIKTGHKKTGLFGWGKGKDIYSSVLDVYPELIKANGEFDKTLAQTIIDTREMSEEDKAAFQTMIDYAEAAEEAWQSVQDYFSSIFGEFGNTLSNCLVDAFINGKSAAKDFTDSVGDMLENLAQEMVYSMLFQDLIDEAQTQMEEITKNGNLTDEQKFAEYARIIGNLTDDVMDSQDKANALYEQFQAEAKKRGIDIFDDSVTQQASSKGFNAMSQDTGDELNGRFTAIQIGVYDIREMAAHTNEIVTRMEQGQGSIVTRVDAIQTAIATSNIHLTAISKNTKKMAEFGVILEEIRDNTKQM